MKYAELERSESKKGTECGHNLGTKLYEESGLENKYGMKMRSVDVRLGQKR